ncbi:MAG: TetR/AcrR family transcriptional regulator [Parvularculaceae bacterium]
MPAEAASSPKWRRRSEHRPDEILDAALVEFERVGFDAARVEDIAQKAGISKAGVYLYFDTKDAILRGLIEREVAPVARRFRKLAEMNIDDPAIALRMLITAIVSFTGDRAHFAVPRIVLSVASRYPDIAAYYRENVVDQVMEAVRTLHSAGVDMGVFRPGDSTAAARAVIGPLFVYGFYTHLLGGDPGPVDDVHRMTAHEDILFNGLLTERELCARR